MLNLLARLLLFRDVREQSLGARISRVMPVDRTGLHIALDERAGLRIDSLSQAGLLLASSEFPTKLKGGRGIWPELAAAADNAMRTHTVDALRFALRGDSVELCTAHARLVFTATPPGDAVLVLETVDEMPRTLPPAAHVRIPAEDQFRDDVTPWIEALVDWLARARHEARDEAALRLEHTIPELSRRQRQELLDLRANDHDESLCRRAAAGERAPLIEHAAAVDREHRANRLLARRRDIAAALLRRERDRVDRARHALAREDASAPDSELLRRHADALLSAPRDAIRYEDRMISVPDPYDADAWITVTVDPPGASLPQLAERLYNRARKLDRGRLVRAERQSLMAHRATRLAVLCAASEGALDAESVAALEQELRRLGLAAGEADLRPQGAAVSQRGGNEQGPARVYRSPSGLDVLVGRSARQNDQLTFKIAAADDFWFHVKAYPGAHVVLRLAGRVDADPVDLRFAAHLAAAHSRAPKGEAVDVHLARRKHLARPKGGKPGQVLIKRSGAVMRVVAAAPPQEPG
ncbi:MAG: NFACT RNA binding domain-containing protein [Acidobacteriota bacterium]